MQITQISLLMTHITGIHRICLFCLWTSSNRAVIYEQQNKLDQCIVFGTECCQRSGRLEIVLSGLQKQDPTEETHLSTRILYRFKLFFLSIILLGA